MDAGEGVGTDAVAAAAVGTEHGLLVESSFINGHRLSAALVGSRWVSDPSHSANRRIRFRFGVVTGFSRPRFPWI